MQEQPRASVGPIVEPDLTQRFCVYQRGRQAVAVPSFSEILDIRAEVRPREEAFVVG